MSATWIAVAMTVHDRRAKTLACLSGLLRQRDVGGIRLSLHLCDDGSVDGTGEAVRAMWPGPTVIAGSGAEFWGGGMRKAMRSAIESLATHVLWLNDDVLLDTDALGRLVACDHRHGGEAIVAGTVRDPVTGGPTYGGVVRLRHALNPLSFRLVSGDADQRCDAMNGNVVLIPRRVVDRIGLLDPTFRHAMGDFDYGLRARRAGIPVIAAAGTHGTCSPNPIGAGWRDPGLGRRERLRRVVSPKALPPAAWFEFCLRHGGVRGLAPFASPYLKILLGAPG